MTEIQIDKIIRSRRRSVGLEITPDSKLVVRAPNHVSEEDIQNLLHKKADWITEKKALVGERQIRRQPKQFISGESFYYLGKPYQFKLIEGDAIRLTEFLEFPKIFLSNAKQHLIKWYKNLAYEKLKERTDEYSRMIGLFCSKIRISNASRCLGSCSIKGNLNFSWRLIMAPLELVDYVVVHELIHLDERNHSRNFWNKVGVVLPDYRKRKHSLKQNNMLFDL